MIPRSFIDVLPEFCIFGICLPLHIMQCGFKETAWSRHPWPWGRRADPAVEPRALPILKLQHHEMKRSETVEGHLAKLKHEARSRSTNLASTRSQLPAEVRIERMLLPVSRCGLSKSPRGSLILSARDAVTSARSLAGEAPSTLRNPAGPHQVALQGLCTLRLYAHALN